MEQYDPKKCQTREEPPTLSRRCCFAPLHISIPRILLKRNPAARDKTKNNQIQFHSNRAKATFRAGYCTSSDSKRLFSGRAGSEDTKIRSQNFPRRRTGDKRCKPAPIANRFEKVSSEA